MQTSLTYRTNRDLFSNHYLTEHLPETEAWDELSDEELTEAREDIMALWEREKETAPQRNESQLEEKFIRPMFRKLGIPFEVEESTSRTQRRPDYGFFASEDAARSAFQRREENGDFYQNAVAVADAKRWGRPLDTRGSGEHERDFENPSYQIHVYLQETPTRWAVLTDGKKWRLYYGPTSHRLDSYYEIDLPTVLEKGDLEDFKNFYLFFRHEAFLEDSSGECFLDEVYSESNIFAQELGEDLQDNIYEAIKVLSEGFMQYPDNDLSEDDLDRIHDSSLIYLYRLIFVLYAESEGRDLLDTNNEIYEESYSLNTLKQDVADELDSSNPKYQDWQDNLWDRLDELFKLIDQGSQSKGIPKEDLHIPAYNGGLFRTDPDENDSTEARFLANHQVGDAYLAKVIELLTRSQNSNAGGKIFVDYSSLDVRHLGSIYEGLLEYQLDIADEPLALEDGEYVPAGEGDEVFVEKGEVHLTTGSGERKATGSYYTPEYVVEYIVEETLDPLVEKIRSDLVGQSAFDEGGFAEEFAEEVFDLKILDPAMGSGHFLTSAIDYLAREIIDAQERQAAQQGIETVDEEHDINWARRQVAQRCIYGVDLNPLAVELAKVSLWLRTLAAEQPLAFLDHHLKTGNSLVGSDIEEIEGLESDATGAGQNASLADFGVARKGTIEQLMRIYEDFIAIENQDLADVKEMESKYDEFEQNKLRQRLEAMANVRTAEDFGLDNIPSDSYERMAAALEDDAEWVEIAEMQWYQDAQKWAKNDNYFHWKLEYPEVFYSADGEDAEDPGFDAVLGNPPYMRIQTIREANPDIADYYITRYESATGNFDIYVNFTEHGYGLLSEDGILGYIEPHKFFQGDFGKGLRNYLSEKSALYQVTSFGHKQVWDQVSVYTCILLLRKGKNDTFQYAQTDPERLITDKSVEHRKIPADYSEEPWIFRTEEVSEILDTIEEAGPTLEKTTDIFVGLQTSADRIYLLEKTGETTDEGLIEVVDQIDEERWQLEPDLLKPFLKGKDVHRYEPLNPRYWVIFPYHIDGDESEFVGEDELKNNYPRTHEYLKHHEDDLRGREGGKMDHERWYDYVYPKNLTEFQKKKIVTPEISYGPNFTYDPDGTYHTTKVYGLLTQESTDLSPEYILAVLNSPVLWFFLSNTGYTLRGGYFTFKTNYLNPFSLPEISTDADEVALDRCNDWYDDFVEGDIQEECPVITDELQTDSGATHEFLGFLIEKIIHLKNQHHELNLNILDYFGSYSDGDQLGDIQEYQPPAGVVDSIISETTETKDGLRVENVKISDSGSKTSVDITARYKPEDPEEYETDQWGYTETDFHPAMEFVGLTEEKATLIKEFVPVAIERGGGFGEFHEKATKTNSLVDRLEGLTLPEMSDIAGGLDQYLTIKKRAEELEEKIEKTDDLVNRIVYDLYGFDDDTVSKIERTLEE